MLCPFLSGAVGGNAAGVSRKRGDVQPAAQVLQPLLHSPAFLAFAGGAPRALKKRFTQVSANMPPTL